ncbi:MAG: radical SAM protein [Prevotellaceae bacterium]|jgi:radical SAM protein with 4Fe4S-binding SPASM domain|nr:radical SAM protein [Prevotellaceae bacterium]
MKITLNPNYMLKNDDGCVLLLGKRLLADDESNDDSVMSAIHPFHAMILSFVNGDEYDDILDKTSEQLQISREKIKKFIDSLIENNKAIGPLYKNIQLGFPRNTIIKSDYKRPNPYKPTDFEYNYLDVRLKRHKTPSHAILMITNKCATDCIYCYADKRYPVDCKIPFDRIKEIIAEAKNIGIVDFNLIGGEVFLYKQWKDLLKLYLDYGYNPALSVKYPLTEDDVKYLADIKIPHIQISLDTVIPEHLKQILRVNDEYVNRIQKTFEYLEKYKIVTTVHTIINRKNSSTEDIVSIYEFLSKFNNIRYWFPEIVSSSMYLKDFDLYKAKIKNLKQMQDCVDKLKEMSSFNIINGLDKVEIQENITNAETQEHIDRMTKEWINNKALCSGNFSGLYILPTGDVTICEELYWHPHFIIGNVLTQSLEEIWNSEKALSLFNIRPEDIPADSVCSSCKEFDECRSIKQICYRELIKAYGDDKWYYPDVNCPKAPKSMYNISY